MAVFQLLEEQGIPTLWNFAAKGDAGQVSKVFYGRWSCCSGSLSKRLGLPEGTVLPRPVVEFYYKSDELGDPLINDDHIRALNLATPGQMERIKEIALAVNGILLDYLSDKEIDLVDFKLEFGLHAGELVLGDEISPDNCRFWDHKTRERLDKDRFRRDLGNAEGI